MLAILEKPSKNNNKYKTTTNEPAMTAALKKLTREMADGHLKTDFPALFTI